MIRHFDYDCSISGAKVIMKPYIATILDAISNFQERAWGIFEEF